MASLLQIKIKEFDARIEDVRLRMPFKFGIATLTDTPRLTCKVVVEDEQGRRATGYSCDVLPALWFDKAPGKTIDQKVSDQIAMARFAGEVYLKEGKSGAPAFEIWLKSFPRIHAEAEKRGINKLTASFGSSFAERAMMDATCRLAGVSFFQALKSGTFGIDAGSVHEELKGFDVARALPEKPLETIGCRHTVGLGDPLRVADIAAEDRVLDGLPQALEEDIREYGLRWFKIKIDADRARNLDRLKTMAEIFAEMVPSGLACTLDGNEQVRDLSDVEWLLRELKKNETGKALVDSILFIEQPLSRDMAMDPGQEPAIRSLSEMKPLIIDESDNDVNSVVEARALGYAGVSVKNCKGVFKAVLNQCLITKWNSEWSGARHILSSEDLTNTAIVPLQQDFATCAALGIEHSERNGHHYFRGLDHLTENERASSLQHHSDLYETRDGFAAMRIRDGRVAVGSLQCAGYGYASEIEFEARMKIEDWKARAGE